MNAKNNQPCPEPNTEHICVALRVRPLLDHEIDRGEEEVITIVPIGNCSPSRSVDETLSSDQRQRDPMISPLTASSRLNKIENQPLKELHSHKREDNKKKNKNYPLKGGAHYAAQVYLSAVHRKQMVCPQASSMVQPGDANPTSEVFTFDAVLGPSATQTDVFDLLQLYTYCDDAMLEGKAAAILCYGQTGSGKSFTMSGPLAAASANHCVNPEVEKSGPQQGVKGGGSGMMPIEESGIAYQAVLYIAQCLQKLQQSSSSDSSLRLVARASYMELYQERIQDLLQGRWDLKCRWSAERRAFYVEDLLQVECRTKEDFFLVLREGQSRRQQAAHMLNSTSSRSHALFSINFETTTGHLRAEDADCGSYTRFGKLTLVDLAGSERLKDTGNVANDDTKAINRSLFALSNVIHVLSSSQPASVGVSSKKKNSLVTSTKRTGTTSAGNVPNVLSSSQDGKNSPPTGSFVSYRSSTLTKLLMDSLEGNSRTLFIICVTPSSRFVEESLRTLHFAQRVRRIRSVAVECVDSHVKERRHFLRTISELKRENAILCAALGILSDAKRPLSEELVKQHVEQLFASRATDTQECALTGNVSGKPPPAQNSKGCQASFSPDPMKLSRETTGTQKTHCRDSKSDADETSNSDASRLLVSSSQQLPQLVPPAQYPRPFSSLSYRELNGKDYHCDKIASRYVPTSRQGCNALDILSNLPDTTSAMFNRTRQQVAPTQHLISAYETNAKEEKITTNANMLQKYGFRPQQRR